MNEPNKVSPNSNGLPDTTEFSYAAPGCIIRPMSPNLMCQNCSTNQMSPNSSGLLVIIDEFHYEVPGCRKINPNVQEQSNQAK